MPGSEFVNGVLSRLRGPLRSSWEIAALILGLLGIFLVAAMFNFRSRWSDGYDFIGALAFAIVTVGIGSLICAREQQVRLFIGVVLIATYLGSYVPLALAGEYGFSQSGRFRSEHGHGLSATDIRIWSPKGVAWEPFVDIEGRQTHRATLLGWFFSPLMVAERHWIHPTFFLDERP